MMRREKELGAFKRFVMPLLAVLSCVFMVVAACMAHKMAVVYYLIIFAVIMLLGVFYMPKKSMATPGDYRRAGRKAA
jgi:APA family basic amino acid/polyamine antiporter